MYIASLQTPKCNTFEFEQYGFECRQYLRSFYNKVVDLKIEYKRELEMREGDKEPPVRTYASIYYDDENIAFEMIRKGFAKVVKHRMSDTNRASDYAKYQELEQQAIESRVGVHGQTHKVLLTDISNLNATDIRMKAKLLGTQQATIEHVMTGGKMRVML